MLGEVAPGLDAVELVQVELDGVQTREVRALRDRERPALERAVEERDPHDAEITAPLGAVVLLMLRGRPIDGRFPPREHELRNEAVWQGERALAVQALKQVEQPG